MRLLKTILIIFMVSCSNEPVEKNNTPKLVIIPDPPSKSEICEGKIKEITSGESHNFKDGSERNDSLIAGKASPILFVQEPKHALTDSVEANVYRKRFERSMWPNLLAAQGRFKNNPQLGRDVILKEGYIYSLDKKKALALGQLVGVSILFNEPEFWVHRGSSYMKAVRRNRRYYFDNGPFEGETVTMNLFDRVGLTKTQNPLHIDLRPSKNRLLYDSIQPLFINKEHLYGSLRYGSDDVIALFKRKGTDIVLECSTPDIPQTDRERFLGLQNLKRGIMEMVIERLPFDEPYEEFDKQLDGKLRDAWIGAYFNKKWSYNYTFDKYYVYDRLGRPKPPQVCSDFIVDAFDRSAGTWYTKRNPYPKRTVGTFSSRAEKYKEYPFRSLRGVTAFARDNPKYFEVIDVEDRVPMGAKRFLGFLKDLELQVGDVVIIKGRMPHNDKTHYHSFFIFENDPISRLPVIIAGNAGYAALRPWSIEINRTPKRYVHRIIRPKNKFLSLLARGKDIQEEPWVIK